MYSYYNQFPMKLVGLHETASQLCRLNPAAPVLVGVSGGPDSLCLLDGLARLGFRVIVAHFDHRLRADSGQDLEKVRAAAAPLKAPLITGSADVAAYANQARLTLEEAARTLRYRFLFEQARRESAQAVAVGHTADDQVETLLLHLLRGAGLNGLKGMAFRTLVPDWDVEIPLVRPLLSTWRVETVAYCQERGLEPVSDPTNNDVTFTRNRLRHELIPLLETYNPQVRKNLWNTALALSADEVVVREAIQKAWEAVRAGQEPDWLALRREAFLALPVGLQRGVLRQAVALLQGRPSSVRDVDFEAIERAIRFARLPSSGMVDLVQGLRLSVEGERILIAKGEMPPDADWPQVGPDEQHLPIPGELELAGWRISALREPKNGWPVFSTDNVPVWDAWLDMDTLPGELCLRRARPGERFQPLGMEGHSLKLSDFWINEKLPRRARAAWPLVTAGECIVWVPGFRLAHLYRIRENTQNAVHLSLYRV